METIKKIGQFIVLPLIVIFAIIKIFFKSDVQESIDSINNAKKEDDDLANSQNAQNNQANELLSQANQVAAEKEEIINNDIDLDWHKRM